MKRLIPVIILLSLLACNKKDKDNLIWDRTLGPGEALFISASPDSGFIAAGQSNGKPFLVRYNKKREKVAAFTKEASGLFSSAWCDTTACIAGGSSAGKMLIVKYNWHGNISWEKSINAGFNVLYTKLFNSGNGRFVALGTASSDSTSSVASGLYFVVFDTAGTVISEKKISESLSLSSVSSASDNSGNIYLALTKKSSGGKPMAYAAKYNSSLLKIWEKALFNNASYASTSLAVTIGGNGSIYVAGKTEVPSGTGYIDNSFVTCLTSSGEFSGGWTEKRYPEIGNEGSALLVDASNTLMLLNRNCMVVDLLASADGTDAGVLRTFSECVPKSTDAYGNDFALDFEGNILLAGKQGGNFFIGLRGSK
jgi:hypothetical protein